MTLALTNHEQAAVETAVENHIDHLRDQLGTNIALSNHRHLDTGQRADAARRAEHQALRLRHSEHAYRKLTTNHHGCYGIDRYLPAVSRTPKAPRQ